jgi:hypothetical protein
MAKDPEGERFDEAGLIGLVADSSAGSIGIAGPPRGRA